MIRTLVVAALVCALALSIGAPITAGPLTGAPAIKFNVFGTDTEATKPKMNMGVGLGLTGFNFSHSIDGGTAKLDWDTSVAGPILSGDFAMPLGKQGGMSFRAGAWIAPTVGTSEYVISYQDSVSGAWASEPAFEADENPTFACLNGAFNVTENFGVELGIPLWDLRPKVGTALVHLVGQAEVSKGMRFQAGIGTGFAAEQDFSETYVDDWTGYTMTDNWSTKTKTRFSLFANGTMPVGESLGISLSLWYLNQKISFGGDYSGTPDATANVLQWALSGTYAF